MSLTRAQDAARKRRTRALDPGREAKQRREYYAANRERILERQTRYYREVWKLKDAGVIP